MVLMEGVLRDLENASKQEFWGIWETDKQW